MPQPPFQADGIQIEPGSGQVLTITRNPSTGSLRFVDAVNLSGLDLVQLAGLSTISGVLVVGPSGSGAQFTDLQSAHDAVPASSSLTNPHLILVLGGVYTSPLTITKAGITFQALGRVVIQTSSSVPCVTVQQAVTTSPTSLTLQGFTLIQPAPGLACVKITGGAGSTIGSDGIILDGCTLLPTGVGGFTVDASVLNNLTLRGCQTFGVPVTVSMRITQCADCTVVGGSIPSCQMDYDTTGTLPSLTGCSYVLSGCSSVGDIQSTLFGDGSLTIQSTKTGNVTVFGDRSISVRGSSLGNLSLNGSTAAVLSNSTRGAVVGSGTLAETQVSGTRSFTASALESVAFPVSRPHANYTVVLDTGVITPSVVLNKTASGFDIQFSSPVTTTVRWTVLQ